MTMRNETATGRTRLVARTFGAVVLAGTVAAGAVAVAPTGNASCMSFFGRNNSDQCVSSATSIAIALGDSAVAVANGVFTVAFADSRDVLNPPTSGCSATGTSTDPRCTIAAVASDLDDGELPNWQSVAIARGEGSIAYVFTADSGACVRCVAVSLDAWDLATINGGRLNAAINVGNRNSANSPGSLASIKGGSRNVAANINTLNQGSASTGAEVHGSRSIAVNLGTTNPGVGSFTRAGTKKQPATSSVAFNLGGADHRGGNNTVEALGDRAVAGAISQTGVSVTQTGPGRTIRRGTAAAAAGAATTSPEVRAARGR